MWVLGVGSESEQKRSVRETPEESHIWDANGKGNQGGVRPRNSKWVNLEESSELGLFQRSEGRCQGCGQGGRSSRCG